MKKYLCLIAAFSVLLLSLVGCEAGNAPLTPSEIPNAGSGEIVSGDMPEDISKADLGNMDFEFTDRDGRTEYESGDVKDFTETESGYEITKEGTYILSGDITDITVKVEVGENDKVQLVLDNAKINNQNGPAIFIKSGDKVFITAKEGSENSISDGSGYTLTDGDTDIDAAIFSRADLTFNGSGKLTVNGNKAHAVCSKDDLTLVGVNMTVNSAKVGLDGKDCVKITDSNIVINAGSDGIRSDNAEDADRGYVYIASGSLDITAGNDGIQAETALKIDSGDFKIVSGGGSGGKLINSSESYKGIKASSDVIIQSGNFEIDSLDDAIHSNNTVMVYSGKFSISTGDDGIHADTDLAISGGEITVSKSYEGLEASRIYITGGNIDLTASDDGINAAGGNDSSGTGGGFGRPDMGGFSNGIGEIYIKGGYIFVDALGDGIDSNGSIELSGGTVLVSGPTNNGNGAFDYDGSATVSGGILIAVGSSGMAQNFATAQNQGAIYQSFNTLAGGISIALTDSSGKVIASFTPKKAYQSIVITAPEIQNGSSYSLYSGMKVENADENGFAHNSSGSGGTKIIDITMTANIYGAAHGMGGGMGGGPGGGMGGTRPGRP